MSATETKETKTQNTVKADGLPMHQRSIDDIIDYFGEFCFDDDRRGIKALGEMFTATKDAKDPSDAEMKKIIIGELTAFSKAIQKRKDAEKFFWDPLSKDRQFCHPYIQMWIMSRWFRSTPGRKLADLPDWYQKCCKVGESWTKDMQALADQLLEVLRSYRPPSPQL